MYSEAILTDILLVPHLLYNVRNAMNRVLYVDFCWYFLWICVSNPDLALANETDLLRTNTPTSTDNNCRLNG